MNNQETEIKKFAKEKGKVTIPEIQVKFNLDYKAATAIVHHLVEEKFIWLWRGIEYKVYDSCYTCEEIQARFNDFYRERQKDTRPTDVDDSSPNDKTMTFEESKFDVSDKETRFMLKVLGYCSEKWDFTVADIKKSMACSFYMAHKAVQWMVDNGFAVSVETGDKNDYRYKAMITKEQYENKFGKRVFANLTKSEQDSESLLKKLIVQLTSSDAGCSKFVRRLRQLSGKHVMIMSKNYNDMFFSGFDMGKAVSCVPNIDKAIIGMITLARTEMTIYGQEWNSSKRFESICLEVIEKIIATNASWGRMDAVKEAAKEVAAIKYTGQSREAGNVHARVLYEFLDGSDEDYERLKQLIWNQ